MSEADTPTLAITEEALARVKGFVAGTPDPDAQAMWVEVTGVAAGDFNYNMTLKPKAAAALDDSVQVHDGLTIIVPARDIEALSGATVDWEGDELQGGLNPSVSYKGQTNFYGQRMMGLNERAFADPEVMAKLGSRASFPPMRIGFFHTSVSTR